MQIERAYEFRKVANIAKFTAQKNSIIMMTAKETGNFCGNVNY